MANPVYTKEQDALFLAVLHGIANASELMQNEANEGNVLGNPLHIMLFMSGRINYAEYKRLYPKKQSNLIFDDPNFDVIPLSANLL